MSSIFSLGSLGSFFGSSVNPDKSLKKKSEEMLKHFKSQDSAWAVRSDEAPVHSHDVPQTSHQSAARIPYHQRPSKVNRRPLPVSETQQPSSTFFEQAQDTVKASLASKALSASIGFVKSLGRGSSSTALLTPGTQASVKLLSDEAYSGSLSGLSSALTTTPKANSSFLELIKNQAKNIFGAYRVLGNISPKDIIQTVQDPKTKAILALSAAFVILLIPSHRKFIRTVDIPIPATEEAQVYTFNFVKDGNENTIELTIKSGEIIPTFTQLNPFNHDTSKSSFGFKSLGLFNFVTYKANEYRSLYTIYVYDPKIKQKSESWIQISKDSFIQIIHSNQEFQPHSIKSNEYNEIDLVTILADKTKTIQLQPFNGERSNEFIRIHRK